jgi:hypothetical protein
VSAPVKIRGSLRKEAEKKLCEDSFADFVAMAWPHCDNQKFKPNWHIKVLADHLQAVYEGRIQYLLINIPPGSAKSLITSVMFPAWVWIKNRKKRVISAAHNRDLSNRDSKRCRRLILSTWYQGHWPTKLMEDQDSKSNFENPDGGARIAMALTSMTGERGNIVIIDDPHSLKSSKSPAMRQEAVDQFLEAVPSRLNDPETDAIIVIMQRLHDDDVSGAILSRELGYDHLCIPLYADGVERAATTLGWIDGRREGENMFPTRYTEKYIAKQIASLGPLQFSGQYQQSPSPATDGYFQRDWFKRYKHDELPARLNHFMTSDHAPGGKGDYNVFRVWGVDADRHIWLVDSFRAKCLMDEALGIERDPHGRTTLRETGALPLIKRYKPLGWFPENDNTWVAIQSFVRSAMIETQVMCRITPLSTKGSGDKEGKAQAYQAMAANGLVHLPAGEIGDVALEEYQKFPVGRHDDQVDADGAIARVIAEALPAFVPVAVPTRRRDMFDDESSGRSLNASDSDLAWG